LPFHPMTPCPGPAYRSPRKWASECNL
jgi:hypothetical protein